MSTRKRTVFALVVGVTALAVATLGLLAAQASTGSPARPATGWRLVKTVSVRDRSVILVSIEVVSARDAWVGGVVLSEYGGYDSTVRPLLEHWNGVAWRRVALPAKLVRRISSPNVFGYVGASAGNVWAFSANGSYLRRTGGRWSFGRLPGSSKPGTLFVSSVTAFGPRDVWVFGERSVGPVADSKFAPYAARFDGRRWTPVKVPGKGLLRSVSAPSPRLIWGIVDGGQPFAVPGTIERWNGTSWQVVKPAPKLPRRTLLTSVLVKASNDVWVGGGTGNGKQGLTEVAWHWNGRAWAQASPSSAAAGNINYFASLIPAPGGLWGLGAGLTGPGRVWRYAGGAWSGPVRLPWNLGQLAAVPHTGSVWAIGDNATADRGLIVLHGRVPR